MHPWMAEQVAARRAAELRHDAELARLARQAPHRGAPRHRPGPLSRRAGRMFVALGWRLGGAEALPAPLQRRLV